MDSAPFLAHFDYPSALPPEGLVAVRGWVVSQTRIRRIRTATGPLVQLSEESRPDVRNAHPSYPQVLGFKGLVPQSCIKDLSLSLLCETESGAFPISKSVQPALVPEGKKERLERLRPFLRKGLPFRETPFFFDYLTPELREKFHVQDTANISEFAYAPIVQDLIRRYADGLVLDCGAGQRSKCLPNVINLEIVPYPSTDVLATNEQLPFEDNSFDLVISCAVLEHVKDPFKSAQEIMRVTKPGGHIYADVPFLQPYHGYPSHYYNMTHQGLANLFAEHCEVERSFVPNYGLPIWTLSWFLNSYLAGLPEAERERFASMKVSELLASPMEYLEKPFVTRLSDAANLELASVTSLLARKHQAPQPSSHEGFFGLFRRK